MISYIGVHIIEDKNALVNCKVGDKTYSSEDEHFVVHLGEVTVFMSREQLLKLKDKIILAMPAMPAMPEEETCHS